MVIVMVMTVAAVVLSHRAVVVRAAHVYPFTGNRCTFAAVQQHSLATIERENPCFVGFLEPLRTIVITEAAHLKQNVCDSGVPENRAVTSNSRVTRGCLVGRIAPLSATASGMRAIRAMPDDTCFASLPKQGIP